MLTVFLVFFFGGVSQASDLTISIKKQYYDISGHTAKDLKKQMKSLGPPKGHGPYWGYTRSPLKKRAGRCAYDLTITYTLPNWVDRPSAPMELQQEWDRMYSKLLSHESGHGKIAIRAAKEHLKARCRFKKQIKALRRVRNKIYDIITLHGKLTGVYLY